jgi:chemotaxis signal transduction protein
MHFLIWIINDQYYAIDLAVVNSIILACDVMFIPNAPNEVMGAINIHGQVFPVINMRQLLGLPEKEIEVSNHFIVAQIHQKQMVLFVDRVKEVKYYKKENLIPAQKTIMNIEIDDILKEGDHVILVLNLDKLIPAYAISMQNEEK